MPLGITEVDLGPGHIVLIGEITDHLHPLSRKGHSSPLLFGGGDGHRHNKPAASRHSIFIVRDSRWSRSAGGRRDEGPQSCAGPSPIVRLSRDIGGQGLQLSRPGHPAHPPSSDDRNGAHTGVQPDTVSAGLLQRCVARSSSQHSEAAASAEHCEACRSAERQTITISATHPAAALAPGSTTD